MLFDNTTLMLSIYLKKLNISFHFDFDLFLFQASDCSLIDMMFLLVCFSNHGGKVISLIKTDFYIIKA